MPREEEMVRRLSRPHSTLLCRSTGDPRPRRWLFWLLTLPLTVSGSTAMGSQEETRTVTIRSKLSGKWRRGGSHSCAYLPQLNPFFSVLSLTFPSACADVNRSVSFLDDLFLFFGKFAVSLPANRPCRATFTASTSSKRSVRPPSLFLSACRVSY